MSASSHNNIYHRLRQQQIKPAAVQSMNAFYMHISYIESCPYLLFDLEFCRRSHNKCIISSMTQHIYVNDESGV